MLEHKAGRLGFDRPSVKIATSSKVFLRQTRLLLLLICFSSRSIVYRSRVETTTVATCIAANILT